MEKSIVELSQRGYTYAQIAELLHVGVHRIGNVLHYFHKTNEIPKPSKRGRHPKITQSMKEYIEIKTLQDAHLSSRCLAVELKNTFNQSISSQYVSKIRNDLRFKFSPPKHDQELTPEHIEKRMEFCKKMLLQKEYLNKIAFSDESRFVLGKDNRWVWTRKGEYSKSSVASTQKFPKSVMIFAVIAKNYKSKLIIIDHSIDSEQYIDNLVQSNFISDMNNIYGELNWLFMQDGARCHTCGKTMEWLENYVDVITDWPPNSPDLNCYGEY